MSIESSVRSAEVAEKSLNTTKPAFFRRKSTWEYSEYVSSFLSLTAMALSRVFSGYSVPFINGAITFGLLVAITKITAKRLESRTIREKEAREHLEREERDAEVSRLRSVCDNQLKRVMESILAYFWDRYFHRAKKGGARLRHRVTLFRCVDVVEGGYKRKELRIFAREGPHKDSDRAWPVDENDASRCHGVAGRIWASRERGTYAASRPWSEEQGNKEQYCKDLFMSVEEGDRLNVRSVVFTGAPIMVKNEAWGVLLLDSCDEGHITEKGEKPKLLDRYSQIIGHIISGMHS